MPEPTLTLDDVQNLPFPQKLAFAASGNFEGANGTPLGNAMHIFDAGTQLDLFEKMTAEASAYERSDK